MRFKAYNLILRPPGVGFLFMLGACASTVYLPADYKAHSREGWYALRARQLKVTPAEARRRDRLYSEKNPPQFEPKLLGPATRLEAAAIWKARCSVCHGARGRLANVPVQNPMPPKLSGLARSLAHLMGGDTFRARLYAIIKDGRKRPGKREMPAFGKDLSREQIWALVKFVEEL